MGVAAYNGECRKIVMRYAKEWEVCHVMTSRASYFYSHVIIFFCFQQVVNRMGRWIDFENDYKTLYPTFMESVW